MNNNNALTIAEAAIISLHKDNGFSVDKQGNAPEHGYMVSLADFERVVRADTPFDNAVLDYVSDYAPLLDVDSRKLYIGGWVHEGALYLDISENVADVRRAKIAGMKRNQLAIWDVVNAKEITL